MEFENTLKTIKTMTNSPASRLPEKPVPEDLLPFLCNKMRSKRLRKKFMKRVNYYIVKRNVIHDPIRTEWFLKQYAPLADIMVDYMTAMINTDSLARKCFIATL